EVLLKHFGKYADYQNHIFTALSTAYTEDGAFILVPTGKIVEEPIHIIFITTEGNEKILTQPRNLFVAEKSSQVTIIEHYVGNEENIYFTNAVTEIVADENAIVDHIKLQEESKKAFHIARMEVDQERNSNFSSHLISTGADLSRNEFNAKFNDEGGECKLNGLFMVDGTQLFDAHTLMDHANPHCNSHEHYKGILDDKSRGVFNGKVIVRQDAQKTTAFQENNNILLSDEALVNTKPQLEIFADDVKCSHGATIGQMDDEAKFYLKSRGIGEEVSNGILLHAFASDVVTSIKIESIRNYIEEIITKKFNQ
ncbi:MAG: Fe-S cluster assembly protein SufD, partial [Ignavibacteriaceae bacterium]|nr:Fe-S cluster assembly protein SufD [Ignavibacteriaceae bacterium]